MGTPSTISLRPERLGDLLYQDILINGVPLREHVERHEGFRVKEISPLGWLDQALDRLLLLSPPDFEDGRTSLLVCGECGDLGCGAVSAVITCVGGLVRWEDMGHQDNLGIDPPHLFSKVRGFDFDWSQYRKTLTLGRECKGCQDP